jgi:hypothetical protein
MFCSECEKQVENNAKFCANCGSKQAEELFKLPAGIQTTENYNTYSSQPSHVTGVQSNTNHTLDINNKGNLNTLIAVLLTLFFNSFGLFYASITGGAVMTLLNIFGVVVFAASYTIFTPIGGWLLFFFGIWFGSILWAVISTKKS